ncbi:hypothetical protein KSF_001980 [Reticulibacter mediterranei]|uniref:Uncharacterized protein n=1 Tax=Reticulibacter mediterranei TaxID=2778369 RepID=A0A8J3IG74_9CHLR|nr:hypothetical protein [Reticulibacter mediterranei]GHO90150.1 hypothetical protein KSF_001980 [Reticulibacter mediterranei]
MRWFQQAKALLHTKRAAKRFLVLASLFLSLTALFLFADTPTASAASIGSRSPHALPATSGGGCTTDSTRSIRICLSENSQFVIVPDAYILKPLCNVFINLRTDPYKVVTSKSFGSNCYSAGTHLYGYSSDAAPGIWYTEAGNTNHTVLGDSPFLYP